MEIDMENSTFECIKFKPISLTYSDIQKSFQTNDSDRQGSYIAEIQCSDKHENQLIIYRKLLEIADYFNKDWKPDWYDCNECKFTVYFDYTLGCLTVAALRTCANGLPIFRTCADAYKAIQLISENKLKILFQ